MTAEGPPGRFVGGNGTGGDGAGEGLGLASADPSRTGLYGWDVALCVSGTVVSCENALVVAVLLGTPTFRAPMFLLIGSLAAADLLAGLGLVLHFASKYCLPFPQLRLVLVGLLVTAFTASINSLLAIAVDRYLSLYNALTYYSEGTVTRTHAMLLLAWGGALGLGLLPVLGWNCLDDLASCGVVCPLTKGHLVLLSASFFVVFALMLHLYARICRIVCRHAQQIALQRHLLATSHYVTTRKGIATLAVILGTFATCWVPFAVYCLLGDATYPPRYAYLTLLPATCNSVVNPVIYAFRQREIQKVLWAVCCCCCCSAKAPFGSRSPSDV
ncbi:G-protein coupled receptor 3 isoform X2 [Ornithorhynchus anatinus]|uniref:G protein-coupled receptor 3 n=2 Tax=Ornithorhynchus anatinus TaxID=9258 RepID=F6U874_ORNAN|nr:G-protein coupled receptor 3 isoform X2 [Ornithorhynchus anatinus]